MNPQVLHQEAQRIVTFLKNIYQNQQKAKAVIAVSGGIDSALSLTLLTQAIGPDNIFPLFLPYGNQDVKDSTLIVRWNKIPEENWQNIDIAEPVDAISRLLALSDQDTVRKGNIMARVRMIAVFDRAKKLDALVCGTENKSEHYLGYFTRFGDSASDIEPICHLYKTQVRQLVELLDLPKVFLEKAPSAGLWQGQTDESEMGFGYEEADRAIEKYLNGEKPNSEVEKNVFHMIQQASFKLKVPYQISNQ